MVSWAQLIDVRFVVDLSVDEWHVKQVQIVVKVLITAQKWLDTRPTLNPEALVPAYQLMRFVRPRQEYAINFPLQVSPEDEFGKLVILADFRDGQRCFFVRLIIEPQFQAELFWENPRLKKVFKA